MTREEKIAAWKLEGMTDVEINEALKLDDEPDVALTFSLDAEGRLSEEEAHAMIDRWRNSLNGEKTIKEIFHSFLTLGEFAGKIFIKGGTGIG